MAKRSIKRNSRAVALLACIALAIGLLPAAAFAEGEPTTGMPLAASALGATSWTGEPCGDNLTWTLDDSRTLTISGTGAMYDYNTLPVPWRDSRERIASVVIGDGVTSIGYGAFAGCTCLEYVEIPGSVTSIGIDAFGACTNLADVYYYGSPAQWDGIKSAFSSNPTVHYMCGDNLEWNLAGEGFGRTLTISGTGEMYDYSISNPSPWNDWANRIASVVIEGGVSSIGDGAFFSYTYLASVDIPATVTSIGDGAFSGTPLTGVEIPEGVATIGCEAFSHCAGLASVEIPSSVTSIGDGAFGSCNSLEHIYVDNPDDGTVEAEGPWYESFTTVHWKHKVTTVADPEAGGTVKNTTEAGVGPYWDVEPGATGPTEIEVEASPGAGYVLASLTGTYKVGGVEETLTPQAVSGKQGQYSFDMPNADVTVTASFKPKLTITANDQAYTYTGKQQGEGDAAYEDPAVIKTKVTVEGQLAEGDEITSLVMTGMQTSVGAYGDEIKITGCEVGNNTGNYAITFKHGTLTIKPAEATVATGSASKAYDGRPLTNSEASITGLVNGETATVEATGSQTEVGSSANTYSIEWGSADPRNYTVSERLGTLTVEAPRLYTVKWLDYDGAELYRDVKVPYGTVPKFEGATPTRPSDDKYAYEFAGWDPEIAEVTEDAAYTAKYKAAPRKGVLTFDLAGGTLDGKTGTVTVEANVGDTIKLPGAPTKRGYAFKFWKGSEYAAGAEYKVEGDHAFAAEWAAVHTVAFDANGHGKAPDAQEVEHGKKAKKPASPTADGYTFGGWYTDKACKEAYDFSKPVTADLTLYAKWTRKSSSGSGTSPKTGDPLAGAFAVALVLAAASALALALSRHRRRG